MTTRSVIAPLISIAALALVSLSGCAQAVVGGGAAAVGVAAAQQRTLGDAVDDAIVHAQVTHELFQKDVNLYTSVNIEVMEGRVMLTGTVDRHEDRIEAVRLTWKARDVKEVINEIQVVDTSTIEGFARDSWISTQLKTRLVLDKDISSINYNIETINGVVYLIGVAGSRAELERVTNHARTIPNVRRVVSHVRVQG